MDGAERGPEGLLFVDGMNPGIDRFRGFAVAAAIQQKKPPRCRGGFQSAEGSSTNAMAAVSGGH